MSIAYYTSINNFKTFWRLGERERERERAKIKKMETWVLIVSYLVALIIRNKYSLGIAIFFF